MILWINERESITLQDQPTSLSAEIASRARSIDFWGLGTYLPDPDPVLRALGQDVLVYHQLLADPHVFSCYQSRKGGVLSSEWQIEPELQPHRKPHQRQLQMIKMFKDRIHVYDVVSQILDAIFYGFSVLEIMWEVMDGYWLPVRIEAKPNQWFVFDRENQLRFLSSASAIDGELLPPRKFLLTQHYATYENPYGQRILSKCFWPITFKKGGWKFWVIFAEKYGIPTAVGKVPRGTKSPERNALLSKLSAMVQDAVIVLNDDESVSLLDISSKGTSSDLYSGIINTANAEVSKVILGQTLTTEIPNQGSYAAVEGHLKVRKDLVESDKKLTSQAMNILLAWMNLFNCFRTDPPVFHFFEEEDVHKDQAQRDKLLTDQGVEFTPRYYQRAYNLREDEFTLRKDPLSHVTQRTEPQSPNHEGVQP